MAAAAECAVCTEPFSAADGSPRQPRVLAACGHSFCTECLTAIARRAGGGSIACPTCRQTTPVTESGAAGLNKNWALIEQISGGDGGAAAPPAAAPAAAAPRAGDWSCPRCSVNNFASRPACFKCGVPRAAAGGGSAPPAAAAARPGDWTCPGCAGHVFGSKAACFKCGTARPGSVAGAPGRDPHGKGGGGKGHWKGGGKGGDADWACPNCRVTVFASKAACFKCGTARPHGGDAAGAPAAAAAGGAHGRGGGRPGDWSCPRCGHHVFAAKAQCFKCGTHRDGRAGRRDWGGAPPTAERETFGFFDGGHNVSW